MAVVIIEDTFHAEWQQGKYASIDDAFAELQRRATLPWDQSPNRCPCGSKNCHRDYVIIEYDDSTSPWTELQNLGMLEISNKGAVWIAEFTGGILPK